MKVIMKGQSIKGPYLIPFLRQRLRMGMMMDLVSTVPTVADGNNGVITK